MQYSVLDTTMVNPVLMKAEEKDPVGGDETPNRTDWQRQASAAALNPGRSLFEVMKGEGRQIPQAVKLWVERYENDPTAAMVELLSMLFKACGANYTIETEVLDEDNQVGDLVDALVNLAIQGEVEDYQSSKKKDFRNFNENLLFFWDSLVIECQNGPLFDEVLFDKCMQYIIALSRTPPRVYRQLTTLMGLQLGTSFTTLAKTLVKEKKTSQRQLTAEKKKPSKKKRDDWSHLESLNERLSMIDKKITMLEEMMERICTELFLRRYQDIDPIIRMSCVESLGVWILSYPSVFLQDEFLNYLGLTLNDTSAGVRKASVLALQNLYNADDNVPSLGLFTKGFSNRMIELAHDSDGSVALCAIGLIKQLLRHQLLPSDDLGPLFDLLKDDRSDIRHAVGELVYDFLIAQKFNSSQTGSRGADNSSSEVHLNRLLQILRPFSTDPIHIVYVVDEVWEHMKAMKDWKCIVSLLLTEDPPIQLTDDDATNLARLLFASVRKAVGEKIAFDNRKPYHNKAQRETFENHKRDITICMMRNYPLLLCKFMDDKAKIPSLVEIMVHMNLELCSLRKQKQNFKNTLQLIREAFFMHGEKDVLRSCVKAVNFCSAVSPGELKDFALNELKNLEDELIDKLKSGINEAADGNVMLVNLKRLHQLQLCRRVPIEGLYKDFVNALRRFRNVDNEVVSFLLVNMHLHIVWSLESISNSSTFPKASLSSLVSKRNILFEELEYLLGTVEDNDVGTCGNQLACRVCIILAEAWIWFGNKYFSTELECLGYCPEKSVLLKFLKACVRQLNISDETEDEDMNRENIGKTAVMIALAQLFATETISKEYLTPEIISHFVMHGEIVKHLIPVIKKADIDVANMFLDPLKRAYDNERYLLDNWWKFGGESFSECDDLAARLSGTLSKHRSDILMIVRDGIEYALVDAPKQLSFLECAMLHFVSKLPTSDIMDILKYVESRMENLNTDEDPSGWRPYYRFMNNLQEKYAKNEGFRDEKEGNAGEHRGRPRKRRNIEGKGLVDDQDSSEEENSIGSSDQEDAEDEEDR